MKQLSIAAILAVSCCLSTVQSETLAKAIMNDMLPDSSSTCNPPSGRTSHSFTFESSQDTCEWFKGYPGQSEKYNAPWSNLEQYAFGAKMTHKDSKADRSWTLRFGTGGNIYGFYGHTAGEMIAPQKRVDSPWIDDVWHSVGVDVTANKEKEYMIHGAGSYQSDFTYSDGDGITVQDQPFYTPNLGMHCSDAEGECAFLGWAQHGPIPVSWESPLINVNRYKNCGNGIIEHTMVHHNNMGSDKNINRLDAPFGSVRMSTFRDMVLTNTNSEEVWKQEDLGRYDTVPEKRQAKDTLGYVIFAQDLPSSKSGDPYPIKSGLSHTVMSGGCSAAPDQYPYKAVKCKIESTITDTDSTRSAIAVRGTPSDDYFTAPCDKSRPDHCVRQFKFQTYGSGTYCRNFGTSISCRLQPGFMDNFVNGGSDRSFIKFSSPGIGEFTASGGIFMWSIKAGSGVYSIVFDLKANVDKSLSEINALIGSNSDAAWEVDYFNPPGAGGIVTSKNGIIHFSAKSGGAHWLYFYADEVDGMSIGDHVRNKFPQGSTLELLYDFGKPESDNLAMAHVYGNDFSDSRGVTPGWPLLIVGQGNEGAKPRDANFHNIVTTANRNTNGGSHHYRQFFVVDRFNAISPRAAGLADDVIQDNYNVRLGDSGSPVGRTIDLYSQGSSVGASIGGDSCDGATKVCTGNTTPKVGHKALFQVECGSKSYIGSDPYHFAKDLGDGKLRPYICKNDHTARGKWKLLGFFPDGDCASISSGFMYEEGKCTSAPNGTSSPTKSPTGSSPTKSPTVSPPKVTPIPKAPTPGSSPTKSPTTAAPMPSQDECEENGADEWLWKVNKKKITVLRSCGWLEERNSKQIAKYCKLEEAYGEYGTPGMTCPKTCDTPCGPTKDPTKTPTKSPTKAPPTGSSPTECEENGADEWLLKVRKKKITVLRSCGWLEERNSKQIAKYCKLEETYGEYGTPGMTCPKTCDTPCSSPTECEENGADEWLWKVNKKKITVLRSCGWLEERNSKQIAKYCKLEETYGEYGTPGMTCPKTCDTPCGP